MAGVVAARLERSAGNPELRVVIDGVAIEPGASTPSRGGAGGWWRAGRSGRWPSRTSGARHIRLLAGAGPAADRHATLKAPMPGLVLRVLVSAGDRVAAGAPLLALEAMKMENELKAPVAGRGRPQVLVAAGPGGGEGAAAAGARPRRLDPIPCSGLTWRAGHQTHLAITRSGNVQE